MSNNPLKSLIISAEQRDWIIKVLSVLQSAEPDTLSWWWCFSNAHQWPEMDVPFLKNHETWCKGFLFKELTDRVPKNLRLAQWRLFSKPV